MGAEPLHLDDVIASVADGTPIEWDAIEAAAGNAADRRRLQHLRIIAGVADVHRTVGDELDASAGDDARGVSDRPTQAWPIPVDGSVKRWSHLLLFEKLGEGAYGEVYRARDPWLDREVALKLHKAGRGGSVPADRMLQEGRTLARVKHPNVVTVFGADVHEGRVGLWMELVPGLTLEEQLTRSGAFSVEQAVDAGRALCDALQAVHDAGLVHRDVKTQNVMREPGGRLVLMDFGAGHAFDRPGAAGVRPAGTPLYLAPEALNGGAATVRSDIYALGVLLYRLVTGEYPLSAATIEDLAGRHARGDRRFLREARPDLPERFTSAVDRALDPDPAGRFASAAELGAALAGVATPLPDLHAGATTGRRPWLPGLLAACVAAGIAAALVGTFSPGFFRPAPGSGPRLVAVLPLTSGPADADFAHAMTEAIVQELAGVQSLRVVSRTSTTAARDASKSAAGIARALNADAILEGSVSRTPAAVRFNLRMIRAGSDAPSWARTFESTLKDILELQREVAVSVVNELAVVAGSGLQQTRRPVDPAAHEAYLRGRARLQAESLPNWVNALEQFRAAVGLDPTHAAAHAGMGQVYFVLGSATSAMPRGDAFKLADEAAARALALDERVAEAHVVQAQLRFQRDWDWDGAEQAFKRALALSPSHEYAHERFAMFLAARARVDDALVQLTQAVQLDPLSPAIASTRAAVLRYGRRYPEALAQYRAVLRDHPTHIASQVGLGRTLNALGRYDEAITQYRSLTERPNDAFVLSEIAQAEAALGRPAAARTLLEQIRRSETEQGWIVGADTYAYALGRLGDMDAAFAALDRAFATRSSGVLWLKVDSRADSLRNDSRFVTYLQRLGLSP